MQSTSLVFGGAFLWALVGSASAEDLTKWSDAGEWQIFVDEDVGNGCLMEKFFEDGSRVRIGYLPERSGGFLSVANQSWTDMTEDESFTVRIDLDEVSFGGEVENISDDDWRGGYAFFNNPAFLDEFARRNDITITGPKDQPVSYSLAGTSKALAALKECNDENGA
jgi:hypothetical protein